MNPSTAELLATDADARGGTLEILPPEAPLVVFVWSRNRVAPVRVTDFSVTEEAFDPDAQPDPRESEHGPARAHCRRPRLRAPRRHAVPLLSTDARGAGARVPGTTLADARHFQSSLRHTHERPGTNAHRCRRHPGVAVRPEQPLRQRDHRALSGFRRRRSVPYVLRRFVPQARDIPLATRHQVRAGDRIDVIAAHYLGDAELHWRVADANLGDRPARAHGHGRCPRSRSRCRREREGDARMLGSIKLSLLMGPVPIPVPDFVIEALSSVKVELGSGTAQSGFELTFDVPLSSKIYAAVPWLGRGGARAALPLHARGAGGHDERPLGVDHRRRCHRHRGAAHRRRQRQARRQGQGPDGAHGRQRHAGARRSRPCRHRRACC